MTPEFHEQLTYLLNLAQQDPRAWGPHVMRRAKDLARESVEMQGLAEELRTRLSLSHAGAEQNSGEQKNDSDRRS